MSLYKVSLLFLRDFAILNIIFISAIILYKITHSAIQISQAVYLFPEGKEFSFVLELMTLNLFYPFLTISNDLFLMIDSHFY